VDALNRIAVVLPRRARIDRIKRDAGGYSNMPRSTELVGRDALAREVSAHLAGRARNVDERPRPV
jgi:hypothetical protein